MDSKGKRPVSPINGQPLPIGRRFEPGDRAREIGRKGGKNSKAKQAQRKTLREELLIALTEMAIPKKNGSGKIPVQEALSIALIKAALDGNVRAFETIRDTIGEKPVENIAMSVTDNSIMEEVRAYLSEVDNLDP